MTFNRRRAIDVNHRRRVMKQPVRDGGAAAGLRAMYLSPLLPAHSAKCGGVINLQPRRVTNPQLMRTEYADPPQVQAELLFFL